ncbi:Blp family class II bacteriocin [Olivibacter sitiensis]|uniref:Blp family class II bacteriocin n=1 Tax=Olivibacter sitiensis TaxID=376470 RepID=UPI00146F97E1|nr:Blp family class II bacteriocin [Olivibacter sitiensis]
MEKKFLKNAEKHELKFETLTEKELLEIDGGNREDPKSKNLFSKLIGFMLGGTVGGVGVGIITSI